MITRLIDPPCTPFSPIEEIDAWIAELQTMLAGAEGDDDRAQIERSLAQALLWREKHRG